MKKYTDEDLLAKFKAVVCDKAKEVDPAEEMDWFDLSYGFFMALTLNPERAQRLAITARYTHHYWC